MNGVQENMDSKISVLVAVIEAIVFLIPLLKLIWKLSHTNDVINMHEKRLTTVEQKQDKYQEKIGNMLEDIKGCLNKISNTLDLLDLRVSNLEKEKEKQ